MFDELFEKTVNALGLRTAYQASEEYREGYRYGTEYGLQRARYDEDIERRILEDHMLFDFEYVRDRLVPIWSKDFGCKMRCVMLFCADSSIRMTCTCLLAEGHCPYTEPIDATEHSAFVKWLEECGCTVAPDPVQTWAEDGYTTLRIEAPAKRS